MRVGHIVSVQRAPTLEGVVEPQGVPGLMDDSVALVVARVELQGLVGAREVAKACRGDADNQLALSLTSELGELRHPQDTRLVVANEDDSEEPEGVVVVPRNELRLNEGLLSALLVVSKCNAGAVVKCAGGAICLEKVKFHLHVRLWYVLVVEIHRRVGGPPRVCYVHPPRLVQQHFPVDAGVRRVGGADNVLRRHYELPPLWHGRELP
mmetsp:Transcript_60320/g.160485  ORF Transcript_60320/g.160485 Transcript_60320/m.160485 type:complete len:209 (+) Transcript_60320:486-1112(+)